MYLEGCRMLAVLPHYKYSCDPIERQMTAWLVLKALAICLDAASGLNLKSNSVTRRVQFHIGLHQLSTGVAFPQDSL